MTSIASCVTSLDHAASDLRVIEIPEQGQHLAVLKEARLVVDRKAGRETRYYLNAAPLREIQGWAGFYQRF